MIVEAIQTQNGFQSLPINIIIPSNSKTKFIQTEKIKERNIFKNRFGFLKHLSYLVCSFAVFRLSVCKTKK